MLIKCFKSLVFWVILLPLLYTLSGFIILPWWIRTHLPTLMADKFSIHLAIKEAHFNPFTFEMDLKQITLQNEQQENVIGMDHIYINYEPSFLLKKEFYLHSLIIEKPSANLLIDANGSLNLLALFSKTFPTSTTPAPENDSLVMPFAIEHVDIQNGEIHFTDLRQKEPFKMAFGPINYTINNLSFHRDDLSIHALSIMLENEEKISLASSLSVEPLKFNGELIVQNLPLSPLWKYAMPHIEANLTQGALAVRLPFFIDLEKEQPLVSVEKATLTFSDLHFVDTNQKRVIEVPSLTMGEIEFDSMESRFIVNNILLSKPFVELTREKEHDLNLKRLFTTTSTKQEGNISKETPSPWKFLLKKITCEEGNIHFSDMNTAPFSTQLSSLNFTISNLTHDANQSLLYELQTRLDQEGALHFKGEFTPASLHVKADLNAQKLSIAKLQPYLEPFTTLTLQEGFLSLDLKTNGTFKDEASLKLDGNLSVERLNIEDRFKKTIMAWDALTVDDITFSTAPLFLHVKKVNLLKPYVNLDIQKDKSTNFTDIFKETAPQSSKPEMKSTPSPLHVFIGDIALKSGSANFKDASLPIPFATFIDQLSGNFSTLDTQNSKPSVLKLEGKVDKHGYAKIEGSILAFDFKDRANLKLLFKNIDMPSLTPYSGKFVGYAIKEGKLSMDLSYKIKKGLMEGENKINLDSLTLGDPIKSDEATSLPLGLAIAILKDSKGQIDLDLPVSGDLNDPEFRYGSIVWKAFGNLIGSIVTSPFKLLGSMLGIETETLKSIDFSAGEATLIASEEEKMEQYRQILEKRTELKLSITPSYNEALDTKLLKEAHVMAQIEALIPKKTKEEDSYSQAIKKLFILKYSDEAFTKLLKSLKEQHFDTNAINETLIAKIAENVSIEPQELTTLANKRADAIMQQLTLKYKIAPQRLIKNDVTPSDAIRDQWIGCAISVSN